MVRRRLIVDAVAPALGDAELAKPLDMTLAAVVQHVQVLANAGVIRTEKVGRVRTCHPRPESLGNAENWIAAQREAFWKASLQAMDRLLSAERKAKAKKERER